MRFDDKGHRKAFTNLAVMAALSMAMWKVASGGRAPIFSNGVKRETHPWDTVQLTKGERRGKTPDEIQALRKEKYKAGTPLIRYEDRATGG